MYILTDEQLDSICERSAGLCGNNCMKCEAFAANWRYNNGYDDEDEEIAIHSQHRPRHKVKHLKKTKLW